MAKVSSKNQVTIPVDVLREVGVRPGDEVTIRAADGRIELVPEPGWFERYKGSMPGVWPPGAIDELRREWDPR